jgi:predicted MFS family arabinose efflux permease
MSVVAASASVRAEWKAGWTVVLASMIGTSFPPLLLYTSGLFIAPLQAEFGWSRGQITSGLTVYALMSVVFAPFVGAMIDRIGPRRIAILGVFVFCAAFSCLATATKSPLHWWMLWLFVSLGALLLKTTVWAAAVASRFNAGRAFAIAVMLCGTAIASTLGPLLGGLLLENYGWRMTYVGLALIWCGMALPLLLMFFHGADDLSRRNRATDANTIKRATALGLTVGEALRTARFWKLALSVTLLMFTLTATLVHFVPLLIASGMKPAAAATTAGLIGISTMISSLATGFLLDRISGPLVGGVAFLLPVLAAAGLLMFGSPPHVAAAIAVLIGLSVGAGMDVAAYLVTRYFGMLNYGTLFGIIIGFITLAAGTGPLAAGLIYDRFGSYDVGLWAAMPMCLVASLLVATLGRYRFS